MNRLERTLSLKQCIEDAKKTIDEVYEHSMIMGETIWSERSKTLQQKLDHSVHQIKKQYDQLKDYNETTNR